MKSIHYETIHKAAASLARNLLRIWSGQDESGAADEPPVGQLAELLEPGVAAFAGRLLVLAPEQIDSLPSILEQLFASMPTAVALDRHMSGQTDSTHVLAEGLYDLGLRPNPRLASYFHEALDALMAAVSVSALGSPQQDDKRQTSLASLPMTLNLSPYLLDDMHTFVGAMLELGLDRLEIGQAVAADGQTVLFGWEPLLMSAKPPSEFPETAGPDESLEETPGEPVPANGGSGLEITGETPPPPPPPPAPPAPVPANGGSSAPETADLRLDAALPERVTVGRVFDLAVAVMRPASPPRAIDDLTRRESAAFAAIWPEGMAFIQLRIQISAPECTIHGGDTRPVRLLANQDGPPVYFQLTPQQTGPLSVIITVYQDVDWIGSTRLRTEAAPGETRGSMVVTVESHPLATNEVNQVTLWKALDDGYNDAELRDLCFELGIDYEDLPGDTQSAKARELVLYAKRHDQTAQLVGMIMAGRPHLLTPA